ncbi:MAG TPA: protein kinase [Polyangiaceae bacterium]|nr:protein kinase [Polyangiaceae bacterium]
MAGVVKDAPAQATEAAPGRVLLVDDQPELRRLFQRTLTKAGHHVSVAENGRKAVELVANNTFDVVISDVRMPDMGGVELLQALHAEDPDMPVLLVSGSPDLETAMKAVEYGAFEYLTKPVSFEKLRASTDRAIEQRRRRTQDKELLDHFRSGTRQRAARAAGEDRESWTGERLGGRYLVGRLLGAGGMGAVYEATREDLGQMRVAVKILHASLAADALLLARFRREAETVGQINHPNIVRILDFRAEPDEPAYLVMELLDGVSLRQALGRHIDFSVERTVFIASQILAALAAVHRAQIIHRDIKPENVVLTCMSGLGDIVKLLDFGVAKQLGAIPGNTLTQTGTVLGTPTYMAPEHARGAAIDKRSDLYAVGTIMYEALAGAPPFTGDNYNALLFAIQKGEPTPLATLRSDLDPDLIQVIRRAMAVDPDERFQTAEEMADALGPWLRLDAPASAPPESAAAAFAPTMVPVSKRPRES